MPKHLDAILIAIEENKSADTQQKIDNLVIFLDHENSLLFFNKSVLAGEHYTSDAYITCLKIQTVVLYIDNAIGNEKKDANLNTDKLKDRLKKFNKLFPLLFQLNSSVKTRHEQLLINHDGDLVNIHPFQSFDFEYQTFSGAPIDYQYHIFRFNILLAYLDDYLECTEYNRSTLQNISAILSGKDISAFAFTKELQDKAKFLEYKINFRYSRPTKEKEVFGLDDALELPDCKESSLVKFYNSLIAHYSKDYNPQKDQELINSYTADTPIEEIKLAAFHHLNRYYCHTTNLTLYQKKDKIQKLAKKAESLYEFKHGSLELFNHVAFTSVVKLLKNSSLRLSLDIISAGGFVDIFNDIQKAFKTKESISFNFLEMHETTVDEVAAQQNYPDYYAYVVFIRFIEALLDAINRSPKSIVSTTPPFELDEDAVLHRIDVLVNYLLEVYVKTLAKLKVELRKVMNHKIKPVSLTYEECRTKDSIDLFLDSSYVLPINFERIRQQLQTWEWAAAAQLNHVREALEIVNNQIDIKKYITAFEDQFAKTDEGFKKQIKDNEFKLVQIVAMFVSIATFVLINVKIFDNKNGLESFGIILGLAACFFVFNLFFHIILAAYHRKIHGDHPKQQPEAKRFKYSLGWYLLIPFCFLIISFLLLYNQKDSVPKDVEKLQKQAIDDSVQMDRMSLRILELERNLRAPSH